MKMDVPHRLRRAWKWGRFGVEMVQSLPVHARQPQQSVASLPGRVVEQWQLLLTNAITANDYYLYGLWRRDLSWQQKQEFVGDKDRSRWLHLFNPPAYRFFTDNKLVLSRFLSNAGIPVPRLLGLVGPEGRAETGESLRTPEELRAWLADAKVEHVIFKPLLGWRGNGFLGLGERLDGALEWQGIASGRVTFDQVIAHLRAHSGHSYFIVEERLRPHPALAVFAPNVLHTARIVTALDGEVEVIAGALRIGTGSTAVDNFSKGNLAAPIDLATGRLGRAAGKTSGNMVRWSTHPVSGAQIEGAIVPDWERGLAVIRSAARTVPFNPLLGWDLGFTPDGPVIVEANGRWDPDVTQFAPDQGLLGTNLRRHLERRDAVKLIGLGLGLRRFATGGNPTYLSPSLTGNRRDPP